MKENKTIRITLRLTPEQHDSIRFRAETAQMSVSAYVRAAAMRHKVVVRGRRCQCESLPHCHSSIQRIQRETDL